MKSHKKHLAPGILILGAFLLLVFSALSYHGTREFRNPVAYAFSGSILFVLEKDRNTLLELKYASEGPALELAASYSIEPDDAEHYYMVRKLFPAPVGIVVQSYIYRKASREFLGYRFSLHTSAGRPPIRLLTVILQNPNEYPEITYAFDSIGQHYFANNCKYRHNIWKIPPSGGIRVEGDHIPPEVEPLGTINGPLDQWEAMAVGPDGSLFVSSAASGKVHRYSPQGEPLQEMGTVGFQAGELLAPDELFFVGGPIGEAPLLTVASEGNRTWVQFSAEGATARVIQPLKNGYPFEDTLVGTFQMDQSTGKGYAFDLANKSFVVFDEAFRAYGSYTIRSPGMTAALALASACLLGLAFRFSRILNFLGALRFPFFFKLLVLFIPLLVITTEFVAAGVYEIMRDEVKSEYLRRSANLAHAILTSLPLSDLQSIRDPQDREGPAYERIYQTVSRLLDVKSAEHSPKWILHKIVGNHYYFGINVWRGAIFEPCVVPKERSMFFKALQGKTPQHGQFMDEQGEWFSTLHPVLDDKGDVVYVLELYRSAEELYRGQKQVSRRVSQVVGITVAITVILILIFSYLFTRPLRQLIRRTEIVRRGDFQLGIEIRSRDEMGDLARAFDRMVVDLDTYTRELARTTAQKESMERELRLARQLQRETLPKRFPPFPEAPQVVIYAEMEPAREVGGDYYDFFLVDDSHLGVVVADVSGKGVPAGLFMMRVRAMLRGSAVGNLSPADTLFRINQLIASENPSAMFVTMFYFICHMESGEITYCNAGHNRPFLLKGGEVVKVGEDTAGGKGLPVGVMEDAPYTDARLQIGCDDVLVVYTDGVTEACNKDGELYGEDRLVGNLAPLLDLSPERICLQVLHTVRTHQEDSGQADDITILAFRRRQRDPATLSSDHA
ncbi:MAG: SpoIIE family protein phosphatase [Deltaproteobacteria bacterium]|nr:SpoIIE family protein phosphatase [Deltaproteobacteria bacterium]